MVLAASLLTSSCIGSFSLLNGYEKWQCNMTSSKLVNGIVGLILQPIVAPICFTVDAIVLNTIEFWTGNNLLAETGTRKVLGSDGRYYTVTTTQEGYQIADADGAVTVLTHDAATDSWSMTRDGETRQLIQFNADGTILAFLRSGKTLNVTRDQAGLEALRTAVSDASAYAVE